MNATQPLPPEAPLRAAPLIIQTVVIYGILMGAVFLLTRRLSQPLARLTAATQTMMTDAPSPPLVADGPEDIRTLTIAFEEMRGRIQKLFSEKDVMLGVTVLILERHVSGTWAQKKAALEVVRDRRDTLETLQDFENIAQTCLSQFPIN